MAFFIPFLVLAICNIVFTPRGYTKNVGWIFVALFCLVKSIGYGMLINIQLTNSTSISLIVTASILNNIALSPLLQAALGFTNTAAKVFDNPRHTAHRFLNLTHITVLIAPILGIIGGINSTHPKDSDKAVTYLIASSALFTVSWLFIVLCTFMLLATLSHNPRTMIYAVTASLPFLLVRCVYSILSTTNTSRVNSQKYNKYNNIKGRLVYPLALCFLMELVVVAIYTVFGMMAQGFKKEKHVRGRQSSNSAYSGDRLELA